jgi:hypothetical protein
MTTISNNLSLISGGLSFRSSGFETGSDCFWDPGSGERLLEQTLLTDWPALPGHGFRTFRQFSSRATATGSEPISPFASVTLKAATEWGWVSWRED